MSEQELSRNQALEIFAPNVVESMEIGPDTGINVDENSMSKQEQKDFDYVKNLLEFMRSEPDLVKRVDRFERSFGLANDTKHILNRICGENPGLFGPLIGELINIYDSAIDELRKNPACSHEIIKRLDDETSRKDISRAAIDIIRESVYGFGSIFVQQFSQNAFGGSIEVFFDELKKRGFDLSLDNLKLISEMRDTNAQVLGIIGAGFLETEEFESFIAWWADNYNELIERGIEAISEEEDGMYYGDDFDRYTYQQRLFALIGGVAAKHANTPNIKQIESSYLDLVQKFIVEEYYGGDDLLQNSSWENFLKKLQRILPYSGSRPSYTDDKGTEEDNFDLRFDVYEDINDIDDDELWIEEMDNPEFEDELYVINEVVKQVSRFGGERSIQFLAAWHQAAPYTNLLKIRGALSSIGPEIGMKHFLPLLKHENTGVARATSKLLYGLELGQLGISERGVTYFKKMYDLGEYNNPDYFVQRLTADGDIGIFTENQELAKYFKLGDLTVSDTMVKARILSFTYEILFSPKADETESEKIERELILEEFKSKYFKFYDDSFFKNTGLRFDDCSFKEQGLYLNFIERADEQKKERAVDFVKKFGREGFVSFLSLDYGGEYGDRLLAIGEQSPFSETKDLLHETCCKIT